MARAWLVVNSPQPDRDMTPERWSRIKQLFAAALAVPAAQRQALLASQTADDAALLAEVQSLLHSHEQPGEFLEPVPVETRDAAFATHEPSRIGERVGAYRIVDTLGRGGMGDVFKAVRDDEQYQAEVAIKLMRADVRTSVAEQRFKNERQILAALDHRNIARLLDGGTTLAGLPYVVMELVAGETIDRYCDSRSLDMRARVLLFLQVCAAVSYAHQHLVVHRDLKPTNILVTADGSVKLLDFGIAKLLEPEPAAGTTAEETRTQLRVMTLEYASPEQVGGGVVTTASDVYSLGVVLYRLLTGRSPYRMHTNDAERVAEILSDASPARPSQIETHTREAIDADLDHILLMALRKEPARRYGSVEQFAGDLRNYLGGLPVSARRGTLGYRFGKFARRNKVPIAAALLVVVSLVTGLGVAIREARIANEQRAVAQRHFDSVRNLANTMLSDVYNEIDVLPGAMNARIKLAQTAQRYLDELSKEAAGDGQLQVELAIAYRKLGDIQGGPDIPGGGDSKSALESYSKSVALLEQLLGADPTNERARVALAKSLIYQSRVLLQTKGPETVLAPARRVVELSESAHAGYSGDYERLQTLLNAYHLLADVLSALQKPEEAMPAYEKMVAVNEQYSAAHPDDVLGWKLLRNAYANASIAVDPRLSKQATFDRMSGLMNKSLAVTERLLAKEPDSPEHLTRLAEQRLNIADAQVTVGDYRAAVEMYRLAAPRLAKAAEDKADARAQLALAMCDAGLGGSLAKTGDAAAAAPLLAGAERRLTELLRQDPENITKRYVLAQVEIFRGEMYMQLAGQPATRSAQLDYLRKARASLDPGVERMRNVNEQYPLSGGELAVMDGGIAALAKVDAELAR